MGGEERRGERRGREEERKREEHSAAQHRERMCSWIQASSKVKLSTINEKHTIGREHKSCGHVHLECGRKLNKNPKMVNHRRGTYEHSRA